MKQLKSKNRNRMADETLDDSLRLANTNIDIAHRTIVSEKPRSKASHWQGFVINCYLLLC